MHRSLLLAALLLAACARPGSPDAQPPIPAPAPVPAAAAHVDACALITRADAEALLGGPVEPPPPNPVAKAQTASQCTYNSPASGGHVTLLASLSPTPAAAAAAFDRNRSGARSLLGGDPLEVAGIGEKAYWMGGAFQQLNVLAKNVWLVVNVDMGGGKDPLAGAKTAAARALAKL